MTPITQYLIFANQYVEELSIVMHLLDSSSRYLLLPTNIIFLVEIYFTKFDYLIILCMILIEFEELDPMKVLNIIYINKFVNLYGHSNS